jgi:hypothetical protein
MKRKVRSMLFILTALISAAPAMADPIDPGTKAAATLGSTNLASLQNPDGGWFVTVGDTDCGAECVYGVPALGLISAYNFRRMASFRPAALKTLTTANTLVAIHDSAPACDAFLGTSSDRPIMADVALLLSLGTLTGDPKYSRAAKAWFTCVELAFPVAADRADDRIDNPFAQGKGLGAWDAAFDILAALKIQRGAETKYALAEAARVIARQPEWESEDPNCPGCQIRAKGLLLYVLWGQRGSSTALKNALLGWMADLVAAQDTGPGASSGSWFADTQTTAYAVLGLFTQGGPIETVGKRGVDFLRSMQNASGGFALGVGSTTEHTEVDSAAVWAMASEH